MKARRILVIGMLIGALMVWAAGFLLLPFIEKNTSFFLGFSAAAGILILGFLMAWLWTKDALLEDLLSKKGQINHSNSRSYLGIKILLSVCLVFFVLVEGLILWRQNNLQQRQQRQEDQAAAHQEAMLESVRNGNLAHLMSNILKQIDRDISNRPAGPISAQSLSQIVSISQSFKPYAKWEKGKWSDEALSPERGQLLLALVNRNLDSLSFAQIKAQANFAYADLSGADLREKDLSGACLTGASFQNALLQKADFSNANLQKANFYAANLDHAIFEISDMQKANFAWADMNGCQLRWANLSGVNLQNAKLRKADLRDSYLQWAYLNGAILEDAQMLCADLKGADLSRTNFANADLTEAFLGRTNLREADLRNTRLTNSNMTGSTPVDFSKALVLDPNWLGKLGQLNIKGADQVQSLFRIQKDPSGPEIYRLERKGR